jgi:hypothetical protein
VWSVQAVFLCALTLLGRSQAHFPAVHFIDRPPAGVSPLAQAYIREADSHIVLITSTSAFKQAQRAFHQCGDIEAIREIAGVIAHEEWHLQHGSDEASAYDAQLTTLLAVGANQSSPLYHKVMRAKLAVTTRDSRSGTLAASITPEAKPPGHGP